ncbi:DUF1345 domain-containing protein [Microbacterium pygmaeum]|uniref:Uncharacterized membrane protein n=1 Tax=Microbacterium pygmaeum TaxID=370764 RepID=A0A1G7U3U8_9MICO|nr:DUF1345 domain-containing protein [Microbacterium pygmaeum]SDG42246.1 Uncharacterized membrane protein [Microbacterium pygmaeum]
MTAAAGDGEPVATRVPRLAFDVARLGLACVLGVVWALISAVIIVAVRHEFPPQGFVTCTFAFSAGSSFVYLVHTLSQFGRLDPQRLRTVLLATNPEGRFGRIGAIISGTGPTIAVQWSMIAIAAVLVFTLWPGLLAEPMTVIFSILVVAASWAVTIVAYAVHYARFDVALGGFAFPGKGHDRLFSDYVYLAVQVQTTFSTSDVSLETPGARRLVTGHTLVSFAFNTVIIAMLISVLFLGR